MSETCLRQDIFWKKIPVLDVRHTYATKDKHHLSHTDDAAAALEYITTDNGGEPVYDFQPMCSGKNKKEREPSSCPVTIDRSIHVNYPVLLLWPAVNNDISAVAVGNLVRVATHDNRLRLYFTDLHVGIILGGLYIQFRWIQIFLLFYFYIFNVVFKDKPSAVLTS